MTVETITPEPLVPAEADLRGYEFMPFYGGFLRASDFNSRCTDAEYRAAVNLWWSSWHQLPPASLPNDDLALARLADLGRDIRTWNKVKKIAMSGFVLCTDGRWYHEFLSVEACIQWETRKKAIDRGVKSGASRRLKAAQNKGKAVETESKQTRNDFDSVSNKGREGKLNTPPTPPGVPPVDNPSASTTTGNGRRHRGGGRWRHDPSAAMAKLEQLGLQAWSHGKSHAQCVERISEELAKRARDHEPGHA